MRVTLPSSLLDGGGRKLNRTRPPAPTAAGIMSPNADAIGMTWQEQLGRDFHALSSLYVFLPNCIDLVLPRLSWIKGRIIRVGDFGGAPPNIPGVLRTRFNLKLHRWPGWPRGYCSRNFWRKWRLIITQKAAIDPGHSFGGVALHVLHHGPKVIATVAEIESSLPRFG